MITLPPLPTAAQKAVDGQETDCTWPPLTTALPHAVAPPAGSAELRTLPAESAATHTEAVGHETQLRKATPSTFARVHAAARPVGVDVVIALPESSTPTQN